MKKLMFMCLAIVAMFANEKEDIYDYFHKNGDVPRADGTTFRENLKPSFDCSKDNLNVAEDFICNSAYFTLIVENNIENIYPTEIYLDNLFSSYYKLIMQHTPKDKKQEVRKIAREAMKSRDSAASCGEIVDYDKDGEPIRLGNATLAICISDNIAAAYAYGIKELSAYLSKHNKKLLDSIFSKYIEDIDNLDYLNIDEFLDKLYMDNVIDETGKLIIKVDSK